MDSKLTPAMLANRRSLAVAPILVTLAAIGNTLVTRMLWKSDNEMAISFALGMLVAQPCLLSIWCALVGQKLIHRVSFSMGILFGLYCLYMLTLQNLQEIPLEVPLVCLGIVVVLTVLIQTPCYVIRRKSRCAISTITIEAVEQTDSQFGIKHLLIATAVAAALVAIAQASFSQLELEGHAPWGEVIGFLVTLTVLVLMIAWLCVGFVFFQRSRLAIGFFLTGVTMLGPLAAYRIFGLVFRSNVDFNAYFNTLAFSIGLAGTLLAVLFIFYAIGYRWVT